MFLRLNLSIIIKHYRYRYRKIWWMSWSPFYKIFQKIKRGTLWYFWQFWDLSWNWKQVVWVWTMFGCRGMRLWWVLRHYIILVVGHDIFVMKGSQADSLVCFKRMQISGTAEHSNTIKKRKSRVSPMFGCLSNLQMRASLSSFWWSTRKSNQGFTSIPRILDEWVGGEEAPRAGV